MTPKALDMLLFTFSDGDMPLAIDVGDGYFFGGRRVNGHAFTPPCQVGRKHLKALSAVSALSNGRRYDIMRFNCDNCESILTDPTEES